MALLMVSKGCERNRRKAHHEVDFHHSAIHDDKDDSRQRQHRDLNHKGLQIQSQQRSQVHAFQCSLHCCQGRIADGRTDGNQTATSGDLTNVRTLINQAAHMHRQSAAVDIIRFLAQQVKQLCIDHRNQEIKSRVCIAHNEEQSRFLISHRIQGQLIVHGDIADFLNIEGSQTCTAAHKNRL